MSGARDHTDANGITRRRFARETGIATAAAAELLAPTAASAARRRRRKRPQTVAIFGGGIAGMTAAHELAERGFEVAMYERRAWGGKARSTEVPHSGSGGRMPLPGEHGFHSYFGVYQNLPDTMRRIPFGSNANGVFDNLVEVPHALLARTSRSDLLLPLELSARAGREITPQQLIDLLAGVLVQFELPPAAIARFAARMAVFASSCDARRLGQWERTAWSDFIDAHAYGSDYYDLIGRLPELVSSVSAETCSAKYMAWVVEIWVIYALLGLGTNGPLARFFNAPNNEAWIDPWLAVLKSHGARLHLHHEVTRLEIHNGRIAGAHAHTPRGRIKIVADWFVSALPVERARRLWTPGILAVAPRLAEMGQLGAVWSIGATFYLREQSRIVDGFLVAADSPWGVSAVPQTQFWASDFARTFGDGEARDVISTFIPTCDRPGVLYGKTVQQCTLDELAGDCWEQMKRHVNKPGRAPLLTDAMLHSWSVDPGVLARDGKLVSEDRLVLQTAGTERYRPDPETAIPNLMLCGDYCSGEWEVGNQEAASYSGRRAANVVLNHARSREQPVAEIKPYQPPEWEPLRKLDAQRYAAGQPNLFDTDARVDQLRSLVGRAEQLVGQTLGAGA